ncbi:glycosyltransferase, group 2 family protein [Anaerococcus hydrogenalis DSM 7454]|uniref:Glycosyltransferase, group 2 family protein n=1 Tax=Anaerococcus hydrogenalis DSM 7454 TaxID=561177 RepID=B6W7G9_9FIRM|nr:glycosyltransferase family 2 protein [Anaerococcus hydrogenalis]EEB36712.1 glycosyltransferase, group 2 family protein [Anaerococcus hydrogenalis DSM 7454]
MTNQLVSIVMPIYNAESYLKDSIESLINQKYKNLEIICVDDGSTDNSLRILKNYKKNDDRIKILKQRNQFAGVARNNGLNNANGKYIMFLDSDDIFEKNMIYNLVNKAEKYNTDIIFFGFYKFTETIKKRSVIGIPYKNKNVISPIDIKSVIFQKAQGVPWNKFYNREFILNSGIKFQNLKSNNDIFFSKMTTILSNRILFEKKRYANYRVNNDNSTQGQYDVKSGNYAKAITSMYKEMQNRGIYKTFRNSFEKYVLDSFIEIIYKCENIDSYKYFMKDAYISLHDMNINKKNETLNNHIAKEIYTKILDKDLEGVITKYLKYLKDNYVSKNSIEFRVGKYFLKKIKLRNY